MDEEGPKCLVDPKQPPLENFDFFKHEADFKASGGISYEAKDNRL